MQCGAGGLGVGRACSSGLGCAVQTNGGDGPPDGRGGNGGVNSWPNRNDAFACLVCQPCVRLPLVGGAASVSACVARASILYKSRETPSIIIITDRWERDAV